VINSETPAHCADEVIGKFSDEQSAEDDR